MIVAGNFPGPEAVGLDWIGFSQSAQRLHITSIAAPGRRIGVAEVAAMDGFAFHIWLSSAYAVVDVDVAVSFPLISGEESQPLYRFVIGQRAA